MNELLLAHLVALSLVVIDIVIRAWRIRLLVPGETVPTFWQTVTLNAYGEAASAVTPARLGGDPARFLGFRRSGVGTPAAIVALGAERALDWVIILAASVGLAVTQGGHGVRGVKAMAPTLVSGDVLPWLLVVLSLFAAAAWAAHRYRRRHPRAFGRSLAEAWGHLRRMRIATVLGAGAITAASMSARVAILPVLLFPVRDMVDMGGVVLASFALLYSQLLLPTPSGAGAVELGFAVGFAPSLGAARVVTLLLLWRVYTLGIGAGLGCTLFLRSLLSSKRTAEAGP